MAKRTRQAKAIDKAFTLARSKNHNVYRCEDGTKHTLVVAKTASDHRTEKNTERDVRGLARQGCKAAQQVLRDLGKEW